MLSSAIERHRMLRDTHVSLLVDDNIAYRYIRRHKQVHEYCEWYKGSMSHQLNDYLRSPTFDASDSTDASAAHLIFTNMSRELSNVISLSKLSREVIAYRVLLGDYGKSLSVVSLPGHFMDRGFSSWTFDIQRAMDFIPQSAKTATILVVKLKPGTSHVYVDGIGLSDSVYQSELVLNKDTKFNITSRLPPFPQYHAVDQMRCTQEPFKTHTEVVCLSVVICQ